MRQVPPPSAPSPRPTLGLTWTYNLAGELLNEQSATNASNVAYTYDDGGNRLSVSLDGTLFVTYGYDDASRLTTITRGTSVFGFGYDNANRRTQMTYPNGVDTAYTYDNLNRLTNLAATHTASATPITNFGYQYDAAGNRTQKSTLDFTEDYKYDPLYRLTRADRTNPGATPPNQWTWGYDAVGNRLSAQKDAEATTSSYNEKNQLTQVSGGGKMLWRGVLDEPGNVNLTSAAASINGQPARMLSGNVFEAELNLPVGQNTVTIQAQDGSGNVAVKNYSVTVTGGGATYTYDANGNLTQKVEGADTWVYTWNALNQLTAVAKNGATVATYQYDPLGRRAERAAGAVTTGWTYDREDILREGMASGAVTARRFIHGPGIDEPLSQEDVSSGAFTYLHADGLLSITRQTNGAGQVASTTSYDVWGNVQGGLPSPFGFTGREWDDVAQMHYYRARWYQSSVGVFAAEDPAKLLGSLPQAYAYVDSNPATFVDPSGAIKVNVCVGATGTAGAVASGQGCMECEWDGENLVCRRTTQGSAGGGYDNSVGIGIGICSSAPPPPGTIPIDQSGGLGFGAASANTNVKGQDTVSVSGGYIGLQWPPGISYTVTTPIVSSQKTIWDMRAWLAKKYANYRCGCAK